MFASAAFNLVVYSFTLASLFCLSCFSYDSARDFFFLASVCLFTSACAFLMNAVNSSIQSEQFRLRKSQWTTIK